MNNELRYIADINEETFRNENVFLFKNELNQFCVFIKNNKNKLNTIKYSTDNLEYQLNSVFSKDGNKHYFHMILCKKNDIYSKEQFFIMYKYLFESLKEPKSDDEIRYLFVSLEKLFKISPEKNLKNLHTGVFGELFFIFLAYQNGAKKILNKYHSNFFSKHDLELDEHNRIEIKTTTSTKRIHHFLHEQLVRNDIYVYVVSILLEESSEGVSLNKLFDKIIDLVSEKDFELLLNLGYLKGLCGISEEQPGPSFSFENAKTKIRFFRAEDLPSLKNEDINGVTNISYDVDCSLAHNFSINDFVNLINKIID